VCVVCVCVCGVCVCVVCVCGVCVSLSMVKRNNNPTPIPRTSRLKKLG